MKPSTEHDYNRRIARVVATILDDPAAPHTVESLADVAHLSPFHFHRIYRALTGEGVAETVQRLRLAQAARRLTRRAGSVIEVALDVGYDSPQAFARAFRGFAGVSPTQFQARQRGLAAEPSSGAERPAVEIVDLAPLDLVCLEHLGPVASISQTFRSLRLAVAGDESRPFAPGRIGVGFGDPVQGSGFRYFAAVRNPARGDPPPGLSALSVAGGLYAVHRLVGPYALIEAAFLALYGVWLPSSGFEADDRPNLEFYQDVRPHAGKDFVTDLLIPIRKG